MWRCVGRILICAGALSPFAFPTSPAAAMAPTKLAVQPAPGATAATITPVTHRRSWRRSYDDDYRTYDYYPRTRGVIVERSIRTYERAPVYVQPPPIVVYPPPVLAYPPRVIVHPPRSYPSGVYVEEVVRPSSCGVYRYWDGEGCVDARKYPPYVGPRY